MKWAGAYEPNAALNTAAHGYWLGLDTYQPNPRLDGDSTVDVAILGGGFSGLWAAYHLLKAEPSMRVAVLEAAAVGYGASGRNGGFAMTLVQRGLPDLVATIGEEQSRDLHRALVRAIGDISVVCEEEGIEADLQPNGLLTVSNSPLQDGDIEAEYETAQKLGLEGFTLLDRDAAQASIHSETFRLGVREEACTLVNPARLVRGLKGAVERAGGTVYEETPVESFEATADGVTVKTPGGTLRADKLLLAANAYSSRIPGLNEYLTPLYSYILLSEPLTDEQWSRVGWEGAEGLEDRRAFLHYARPTVDRRLLWAGNAAPSHTDGPKPKYDSDDGVFKRLEESFALTFPQMSDVDFAHRWGGPIAVTGMFVPSVGWLEEDRVAFAFGYCGHGVAMTKVAGAAAGDLLRGEQTESTELAIVAPPIAMGPAWIRSVAGGMMMRHALRQDDAGKPLRTPLAIRMLRKLNRR